MINGTKKRVEQLLKLFVTKEIPFKLNVVEKLTYDWGNKVKVCYEKPSKSHISNGDLDPYYLLVEISLADIGIISRVPLPFFYGNQHFSKLPKDIRERESIKWQHDIFLEFVPQEDIDVLMSDKGKEPYDYSLPISQEEYDEENKPFEERLINVD